MRTAAMDDYFFNEIKSHPSILARQDDAGGTRFAASEFCNNLSMI